jgi:Na+-translocating ferredoxin:NAD+ oxidoreductase RnfD subunit
LHYTIYAAGSIVTGIWERNHGYPVVYGDSPFWLLLWLTALVGSICWGKPRLVEWVVPFTFLVGFWFLGAVATSWHPDSREEAEVAAFSQAMFLACFCVWGLAVLLAVVRCILTSLGIQK